MKTLLLLVAAAGLAGCATTRAPDYDSDAGSPYVRQHPAPFIYDRAGWPSGYYPTPYAFPYLFTRRPIHFHHGLQRGTSAGRAPQPAQGNRLAGAVRPPHANNQ